MKLDDALTGVTTLGFDTAPVIYFVEANPQYDSLVTEIFSRVAASGIVGCTSVVTLCEVLVQPMLRGDAHLQQQYRDLLTNSRDFTLYAVSAPIAETAARLRAQYRLRTPDALQIATALDAGCEAFLCNDTGLRRVMELRVLILDDLEL